MNNAILTKVKVKSINDVDIPATESNKLRGYAIRLGAIYVCDHKQDEILENIFKGIIK